MKVEYFISVFAYAFTFVTGADDVRVKLYSDKYDKFDLDTILNSDRLVTNYVDCLLSKKPCPPEGKDLKRILPEALQTRCARCSNNQKEGALKVITKLYYSYPRYYNQLRETWDPSGEYHARFEEYLRDKQFNAIVNDMDTDAVIRVQTKSPNNASKLQIKSITSSKPPQKASFLEVKETQTPRPARNPTLKPNTAITLSADLPIINNRFADEGSPETTDSSVSKNTTNKEAVSQASSIGSITPTLITANINKFTEPKPIAKPQKITYVNILLEILGNFF